MPEYKLSSGESFTTIVLPKGTVLFRGFNVNGDHLYAFKDLYGTPGTDGWYCVDPFEQRFFYPAPFASDCVDRFTVHGIFLTNYDSELVLLVNPSDDYRSKSSKSHMECTAISEVNACGNKRSNQDHCLSPQLLSEFPHIQGYIALAASDTCKFKHGQYPSFIQTLPNAARITAPFVMANSRGVSGIPEIVFFPYHARAKQIFDKLVVHPRIVNEDMVGYAIRNRTALNYFPLVYVTESGVYTFPEFKDSRKLQEFAASQRNFIDVKSPLITTMLKIVNEALSPAGYYIGTIRYRFTIDLRTGFYVVEHRDVKLTHRRHALQIVPISRDADILPVHVSFEYPVEYKKMIHMLLTRDKQIDEDTLELQLNCIQASFTKHYQFGQTVYKTNMAIPRSELRPPRKRFTRKISKLRINVN